MMEDTHKHNALQQERERVLHEKSFCNKTLIGLPVEWDKAAAAFQQR